MHIIISAAVALHHPPHPHHTLYHLLNGVGFQELRKWQQAK